MAERGRRLTRLFDRQEGVCFYCGKDCWRLGRETEREAGIRLGLSDSKEIRKRMATREHLKRRTDGGDHGHENVVMACAWCNQSRGDKPVLQHLADMRGLSLAPEQSGG